MQFWQYFVPSYRFFAYLFARNIKRRDNEQEILFASARGDTAGRGLGDVTLLIDAIYNDRTDSDMDVDGKEGIDQGDVEEMVRIIVK